MTPAAVSELGRIDVLYHCAVDVHFVNYEDRRLTELDDAVWDRMIALCLPGAFYLCKHVGRQMLAQGSGSIILSATTDALIGVAGLDSYTAAKGGIVALTRSFAAGMAPDGVRVNTLCPSFVATEPQMEWLDVPQSRTAIQSLHLLPIPEPEDIAPFAVFLASDEARTVTGGIFPVDAGYMAFKATSTRWARCRAAVPTAPRSPYACRPMRDSMRTGADRTLELLEHQVGRPLAEVETPVAVVDLDRLEANLRGLQSYADEHAIALWPHTKTHKSPEIGMLQLELGAGGLTVAKTGEAEVFRDAGAPRARALPAGRRRQVGAPRAARRRGPRAHGRSRRHLRGRGALRGARAARSTRDAARRDGRGPASHGADHGSRCARAGTEVVRAARGRGRRHQLLPRTLPGRRGDDPRARRRGGRAAPRDARRLHRGRTELRPDLGRVDSHALPDPRNLCQRAALGHVRAARPHGRGARRVRALRRGDRHLRRGPGPDRDRRRLQDAHVGHGSRGRQRRDRRAAGRTTCTRSTRSTATSTSGTSTSRPRSAITCGSSRTTRAGASTCTTGCSRCATASSTT